MWKLVEKLLFGHILSFPMYPNSPPPPSPTQAKGILWIFGREYATGAPEP